MKAERSEEYRPDIDGLRALSILAVALYHARLPGFESGYLGVDVFFVISGFLITGQLLREAEATGQVRMRMFYARRVRRLIPAFSVVALGTAALALVYLLPMTELGLFGNALIRSALFYYNIALWRGGYVYDGEPAEQQALMHTWSLGIEEQFYVVWPALCLAGFRVGRPRLFFLVIAAASFLGAWLYFPNDPDAVFFLLPFRAWELGTGAILATRFRTPRPGFLAGIGLTLVAWALLCGQPPDNARAPQLVAVIGAALLMGAGSAPGVASRLLRTKPLVLLGRMSYAWYLWHWPLLVMGRMAVFPEMPGIQPVALVAGLGLAAGTYAWIESPTRRIPIVNPRRTLLWGAAAVALVAGVGAVLEARSAAIRTDPRNAVTFSRLRPTPPRPCESRTEVLGCDLGGAGGAHGAIILWGDSFARALSPALMSYARESGRSVRLLVQGSCPPLLGAVPAAPRSPLRPDSTCDEFLTAVEERLRRDPSGVSGVILAGRWPAYVGGGPTNAERRMFDRQGRELDGDAIEHGLAGTLELLSSIRLRALVVGAPPAFPFDAAKCLLRSSSTCSVSRSWQEGIRGRAQAAIDRARRGRMNVRFLELFDLFCPATSTQCPAGTIQHP
ncbi:MAG: acyltransferase, partial [Vicinamibacteria bacterium]|nr:acyltransferase [Vicinamibacteria bacterium]